MREQLNCSNSSYDPMEVLGGLREAYLEVNIFRDREGPSIVVYPGTSLNQMELIDNEELSLTRMQLAGTPQPFMRMQLVEWLIREHGRVVFL